MSATDVMLVKATLRAGGTVLGAIIGLVIISIYSSLEVGSVIVANLWLWLSVAVVAFVCAVLMQYAGEYSYIFHLTAITVVIVAYSGSVLAAVGRLISVITGILIAMLAITIITHQRTHAVVFRNFEKVVFDCLELSVAGFSAGTGEPTELFEEVRKALIAAEDTVEARKKWRGWFRLRPEVEMDALAESVINLYHQCHNCFITARAVEFNVLLEDSDINEHFGPLIRNVCEIMKMLGARISNMHDIQTPNDLGFTGEVEDLSREIFAFNRTYQIYSEGFLKVKRLRAPLSSIFIALAVVTMALSEYCISVCSVPTVIAIDSQILADIKSRMTTVDSNLKFLLKSGPAVGKK